MSSTIVCFAQRGRALARAGAMLGLLLASPALAAPSSPEIRTSATNAVPACVSPERLMSFLKARNGRLDPRFKDIARHYKTFGDAWHVRWDYAFYQMAIETNFLTYRAPNGRMGDVDPKQNNFAGIGTTGGGVPGDGFPDVKTGVHAQIQHLVVYSGERLAAPIAPRTQLKQDDIIIESLNLGRPVRFGDLARRWAVDRNYDKSIEWVADLYRKSYCTGRQAEAPAPQAPAATVAAQTPQLAAAPKPAARPNNPAVRTVWVRSPEGKPLPAARPTAPTTAPASAAAKLKPQPAAVAKPQSRLTAEAQLLPTASASDSAPAASDPAIAPAPEPASGSAAQPPAASRPAFDPVKTPPSGLGAAGLACSIATASYGGTKTVLIKAPAGEKVRYTALTVLDGFEGSMTANFIAARAPGGASIGEFADRESALDKAKSLCPGAGEDVKSTSASAE